MILTIKELAGGTDILAGPIRGKKLFSRLVSETSEPPEPVALHMDFRGVDVATASFLREGPLTFRRFLRTTNSKLYPTIANANDDILTEFRLLLESDNDAMFACRVSASGSVSDVKLLGLLDEKQAATLRIVQTLRQTDVATLVSKAYDPTVKPTAWNNRLSALTAKGLIMETRQGRAKRFRVTVEA